MTIVNEILKMLWKGVVFGSRLITGLRLALIAGFFGLLIGDGSWLGSLCALLMAGAGFWYGVTPSSGHIR